MLHHTATTFSEESTCDDETDQESHDISSVAEEESKKATAAISLLLKDLITATSSTALRFRVSERQQMAMLASIVNVGGGLLSDFTLSKGSLNRKRREEIAQKAREVRSQYVPPKFHWDSKIFKPAGRVQEDRVAIFVSPPPKLLSIAIIPSSTGEAQKESSMNALESWKITNNIVAAVFDTTSSNTGKYQGAASVLVKALNHPILWVPC